MTFKFYAMVFRFSLCAFSSPAIRPTSNQRRKPCAQRRETRHERPGTRDQRPATIIMQNKPNLPDAEMNVSLCLTMNYEQLTISYANENKPKQSQPVVSTFIVLGFVKMALSRWYTWHRQPIAGNTVPNQYRRQLFNKYSSDLVVVP